MIKPHTMDKYPENPTTIRMPKRDGDFLGWGPRIRF
jgi:hypothetical protein